ncbi:ornithine cyclodeaminase family protein [Sporosarcina sp. Marseille-Q4063]|uniref:ornithine cyclodeaminase family protein n=1 Tax=Sporosarcina sp. Marseille-Q4063 TaxID=2810514 RepID=UPI001BB0010F|nr:ornithine cyclodeaminase family protein [Sporosarcina sp. Marseille-Q4063]QUW23155.1 ornithine cyclodeaminase family protein [Sporosarcina sp. Marseille-Q4063]
MLLLNEKEIQTIYGMKEALRDVEKVLHAKANEKVENPVRTVLEFPEHEASSLYMPSSDLVDEIATVKVVTIFPKNPAVGKPTTQGVVLVTDAQNGEHLALMNASYLTRLRTGALSGLATAKLSLTDSSVLTVIGTGGMAFEQVLGVLEVRDIKEILLVNPTEEKAVKFGEKLRDFGIKDDIVISIERDVSAAVKQADIICCSTRSSEPVFDGNDVKPGTHVNGVGSYLPHMREVDFQFLKRASKIVVDDLHGVTEEAGELIHAAKQPDWSFDDIHGELTDLITEVVDSRTDDEEITFFKSVGAAYFDLAVAKGVYQKAENEDIGIRFEI